MKKMIILFLATATFFSACRKDKIGTEYEFVPDGEETTETRLLGQVIDEDGLPLADALVQIAGKTATSNEDGVFFFEKTTLKTDGELAVIEKDGFFTNYKRVIPTKNSTFQKFGLTKKQDPTGRFDASTGGTVARPGHEKVTFKPNSIVDESGNAYTGEVTVYTDFFNSEKQFLSELMPGDLSGIDNEGTKVQLETYSMILVELFGEAGQKLNLKPGTTAATEFPIADEAQTDAPNEIALWSLDEETGLWVEEGIAQKNGSVYRAELPHFSFWNCDAPFPLIHLEGKLVNINDIPIINHLIYIKTINKQMVGNGYTNDDGVFAGKVPANEELTLFIINSCEEIIYEKIIGPFSNDTVLPNIKVDLNENYIRIYGKVKNCDGENISNGYVIVETDQGRKSVLTVKTDASFDGLAQYCNTDSFRVNAYNLETHKQSMSHAFENTRQVEENIGTLLTCDDFDQYFIAQGENFNYFLKNPRVIFRTSSFLEIVDINSTSPSTTFLFIQNPVLNSPISPWMMHISSDFGTNNLSCHIDSSITKCLGNFEITLSQLDTTPNGFVEGIGIGQAFNSDNQLKDLELSFKVQVDDLRYGATGKFWEDLNKNGIKEFGEPAFENIVIKNNFGGGHTDSLSIDESNIGGQYRIEISSHRLNNFSIEIPPGYKISPKGVGGDDTIDSDFDLDGTLKGLQGSSLFPFLDCGLYKE